MTIATTDLDYYHALTVNNGGTNGGVRGTSEIVHGVNHNLFPWVDATERTAGLTRYRMRYLWNKDGTDQIAANNKAYLAMPSQGGDRYALCAGTPGETQTEMLARDVGWVGAFQLNSAIAASDTSVSLLTEGADIVFINGGYIYISDQYKISQTVDADVLIGNSVTYSGGSWSAIADQDDVVYPDGRYMGDDTVLTFTTGVSHTDFLLLPENLQTDEDIGDGNGSSTAPALTTLGTVTNGIVDFEPLLPVVTATCGATARTVNVAADGSCSGYCSAGQLNMTTGVWDTDITWTTAPDNSTDITCTYRNKCYSYAANVATVALDVSAPNAYADTTITFGSGVIEQAQIKPYVENWVETFAGSGAYDETTYPVILSNIGPEEDTITLTWSDATNFAGAGARLGALGAGVIGTDYEPANAAGGDYFGIDKDGWSGTPQNGDTVVFDLHGSEQCTWYRQLIPAATAAVSENQTSPMHAYE